MKPKGTRVWVAVNSRGKPIPWMCDTVRADLATRLGISWLCAAFDQGAVTIRRATLVLDPVKPKKRRGAA